MHRRQSQDTETGLYYLQSRYYNPNLGRFLNADALVATGQGPLGNNMFAYCMNSPITFVDSRGTYPRREISLVCLDSEGKLYESTLADYVSDIAKPITQTLDDILDHTWSIGLAGNITNGGISLGKGFCISGDQYGNYAAQETTSQGSSIGEGMSCGFYISYTNATNVQDLSGVSYSFSTNFYFIKGASLDFIYFEPIPGDMRWGIAITIGGGGELSAAIYENYTTSSESWHIWDIFK